MIEPKQLLSALQKRVTLLEHDLRDRCNALAEVDAPLRKDYEAARAKGRTGLTYNAWRDEELTQVAVSWVLAGVFVRFLEDNELIEVPFLAGAKGERHKRAQDEHSLFFKSQPTASERDYFEHVFATVAKLPGMKDFFDRRHNPLWRVGPTADAAKDLLEFWRKTDPDTGTILFDFTDAEWNTRFLGDLYQDLSEAARKKYALLQTPVFVEEFILDRTLTPAINTFGYKTVRMIDPTCGSGHFLLGSFERLFRLWQEENPGENPRVLVQRALDGVYGVDLNPNVVAIARFRLLVAALRACGVTRIKEAPDFRLNLAAGDSLLHGSRFPKSENHEGVQQTFGGDELFRDELQHFYESEDREELHRILGQQYHVVVGNPPYITVKDRGLSQAYRNRFDSCSGKYSLVAPFMERFFDLAIRGDGRGEALAGFVGMITGNSFMKQQFGKKLVETFFPKWDLSHVIDTAGAYVPGHGTPTVILLGKHQPPVSNQVRAVLGIRGEPSTPADPSKAKVWTSILNFIDSPGTKNEFISSSDFPRQNFLNHPWSIGGGGALELKEQIDAAADVTLESLVDVVGITSVTGSDDVYIFEQSCSARRPKFELLKPFITGYAVRDWAISGRESALWIYGEDFKLLDVKALTCTFSHLWKYKSPLSMRRRFGTPMIQRGAMWYEWQELYTDKLSGSLTITFAVVATHNHFVLVRDACVFNSKAMVIKLAGVSEESHHVELLGLLNSSTACFWMKQVFHNKGSTVDEHGARQRTAAFEDFYEFSGTSLEAFPIPREKPFSVVVDLGGQSHELEAHSPAAVLTASAQHTRAALNAAKQHWTQTLQRMIALQEELDWECYQLYGLTETKLVLAPDQVPPLQLGERAFEIVMARKLAAGELQTTWFERHGSTPITELPAHWPHPYRELVQRRIALMESDRNIALIEQPEYKRRWNTEPWDEQLKKATRDWLLARLEGYFYEGQRVCELKDGFSPAAHGFTAAAQPILVSTNQLAAVVEADMAFLAVAEIYSGGPGFSLAKLVKELVEAESVPYLPFQRYKDSGLRKRQDWEHVWDLQRKEDIIDNSEGVADREISDVERLSRTKRSSQRKKQELGDIPVPPKYSSGDFKKSHWWKLRGKLDVPKERWVVYPGAERAGDPSPVVTWAGWDHDQQAQALAAYYIDATQNQGWQSDRLIPLLAGLAELLPWLKQWHNEFNPDYGSGLGDYFAGFLDDEARKQGTTVDALNRFRLGLA